MIEYQMIEDFYGNKTAERSGVKLINHIDEGLVILRSIGACETTKAAYCLHPLLQDDFELERNMVSVVQKAHPMAVLLAMEYRNKAQSYLCKPYTDDWTQEDIKTYVGKLLPQVRQMLIADKKQNQKDFILHHLNTHIRSAQLEKYFNNWLTYLGDIQ